MTTRLKADPDLAFIKQLRQSGGHSLKRCYQCATCSVVCELSNGQNSFPRKEMVWAQWGLKDRLMASPNVWLCHQCNDCTIHCPRGAKPGDVLAAVRTGVFRNMTFPSFMGKALDTPKALPFLILVPVILFLYIIFSNDDLGFTQQPNLDREVAGGYFKNFLPHGIIDPLFIAGNAVIFAFAAIGLMRFWKGMKAACPEVKGPAFWPSLYQTAMEILSHSRFRKCTTSFSRSWGHLLVLYGFLCAMATTALVFAGIILFEFNSPIPFSHPIKILGNVSAVLLIVGCVALILQRLGKKEKETDRTGTYSDWLLLGVLLTVAVTGCLSQLGRYIEATPFFAYIFYFIHMVSVFFLLWYAPYSKLAHMFYRTLALVFVRSAGLEEKEGATGPGAVSS